MYEKRWLLPLLLSCTRMVACGNSSDCTIKTSIIPSNATADHSAAVPGDQAKFSLSSTVKGNCPLTPDFVGVWSTSDPVNTTISNQDPTQGLATCLNATPTPATIRNSSTVRTKAYPTSSLVANDEGRTFALEVASHY
jgi:hypothetical protein